MTFHGTALQIPPYRNRPHFVRCPVTVHTFDLEASYDASDYSRAILEQCRHPRHLGAGGVGVYGGPITCTGVFELVAEPSPSFPRPPIPQHQAVPSVATAQA